MAEKPQWELHKEFKHESGIILRINSLPLRNPAYSFEIGVLKDSGYLNRFFPGGLSWDLDFSAIIGSLVKQAEDYIASKMVEQSMKNSDTERQKANSIKKKNDSKGKDKSK